MARGMSGPRRPARSNRATVGNDIAEGIRTGRINVPASVAAAVLEQPAPKQKVSRETPPLKVDAAEEARRAAVRREQEADFNNPNPHEGSVKAGARIKTEPAPNEMNRTETAYAEILQGMQRAGEIRAFWYEEHRLKVGVNSWYTPDFFVLLPDGRAYLVEVKAFRYEKDGVTVYKVIPEDSAVKVKACIHRHGYPLLWAFGRARNKGEGGGYEWLTEWEGGFRP